MRLPVEQACKKHVGSNPTSPNLNYTREMEKLRQNVTVGILVGVLTCVAYAILFGFFSSLGFFEYNYGQSLSLASTNHDSREASKLIPETLLNQLRSIVFQIFILRNLGFYISLGALTGACWRFLRQKNAPIFLMIPVLAIFFCMSSFEIFGSSFPSLSGILGVSR